MGFRELMGWWVKGDGDFERVCMVSEWNPGGGNLKQLQECYNAVDRTWNREGEGDRSRFVNDGKFKMKNNSLYRYDELTAWAVFNNPEYVAECILEAQWVR